MATKRSATQVDGIAVVVNEASEVAGVLTDGDIRRAYARGVAFETAVAEIMVKDPVTIPSATPSSSIVAEVIGRMKSVRRLHAAVRHVLVVDDSNRLVDVLDVTELLLRSSHRSQKVAVYGLGHVGLTLAASLANVGHTVTGVDTNTTLCDALRRGKVDMFEPGLTDMLDLAVRNQRMMYAERLETQDHQIHIVAVGSPVDDQGRANTDALMAVARTLVPLLKKGDLVLLRSTVPVGFTRKTFTAFLQKQTALKAGADFFVAFTPERTVEGRALHELRTLPQIVGGHDEICTERAAAFWSTLTPSVVRVDSLEAAELIKVANNSFRDLSFAFANELALVCDCHNLNAFNVIQAANEGYPRNPIPFPSPGVGGYCLTKDPLLYSQPVGAIGFRPRLSIQGREVNELAKEYPIRVIERWLAAHGSTVVGLRVLAIGMAFKGYPENADLRGSTSIAVAKRLMELGADVQVWDAVVSAAALEKHTLRVAPDVRTALAAADVVLVLNNHPSHPQLGVPRQLSFGRRPRLLFDGWNQFDGREIEQLQGLTYATMGYATKNPQGAA